MNAAKHILVAACILAAAIPATATAQTTTKETNPHAWKPKVTSVAVFKNGLGFFMSEADVDLRDGWAVARRVPPAAFGTLAIFAHDKKQLVDIVGAGPGEMSVFDGTDTADTEAARRERLGAYLHLKLRLTFHRNSRDLVAEGVLKSIGPKYVILDAGDQTLAVPLADISRAQVLEHPLRIHVQAEGDRPAKKATIGMAYLRKGITWVPEYTLELLDDDTAELTLRGTLVNMAEDLVHADVNFVVGVPHFVHTNYMAPLAVGQVLRSVGGSVAPKAVQRQIMNRAALVHNNDSRAFRVVSQPSGSAAPPASLSAAMGNLPKIAGVAGTDYTVYTRKDLTLRVGEKAIITLFRKRIKYSHVYEWTPPQKMKHHLVLRNATDTAWTTGPCLVVSDNKPLSEDILKYVPKGASGEIPVTTAINVAHEKDETEIARKLKAHAIHSSYHLDLVTLRGTLQLKNFEKRTAAVRIAVNVPGRLTEASDDGIKRTDSKYLKLTERRGTVRWTITVEPGKTRTLTYVYERYVRSQ